MVPERSRLFDDIGCLRDWRKRPPVPGAAAFVADQWTGVVPAERAVYVRTTKLWTPMARN